MAAKTRRKLLLVEIAVFQEQWLVLHVMEHVKVTKFALKIL